MARAVPLKPPIYVHSATPSTSVRVCVPTTALGSYNKDCNRNGKKEPATQLVRFWHTTHKNTARYNPVTLYMLRHVSSPYQTWMDIGTPSSDAFRPSVAPAIIFGFPSIHACGCERPRVWRGHSSVCRHASRGLLTPSMGSVGLRRSSFPLQPLLRVDVLWVRFVKGWRGLLSPCVRERPVGVFARV